MCSIYMHAYYGLHSFVLMTSVGANIFPYAIMNVCVYTFVSVIEYIAGLCICVCCVSQPFLFQALSLCEDMCVYMLLVINPFTAGGKLTLTGPMYIHRDLYTSLL